MTALDLLRLYLEYDLEWTLSDRIQSPPATERRDRIEALQEAFGISKSNVNPKLDIRYSQGMKMISRTEKLAAMDHLQFFEEGQFL